MARRKLPIGAIRPPLLKFSEGVKAYTGSHYRSHVLSLPDGKSQLVLIEPDGNQLDFVRNDLSQAIAASLAHASASTQMLVPVVSISGGGLTENYFSHRGASEVFEPYAAKLQAVDNQGGAYINTYGGSYRLSITPTGLSLAASLDTQFIWTRFNTIEGGLTVTVPKYPPCYDASVAPDLQNPILVIVDRQSQAIVLMAVQQRFSSLIGVDACTS